MGEQEDDAAGENDGFFGAARAARAGKGPEDPADQRAQQEAEAKLQEEMLPAFLDGLWNATVLDIETTIREVVSKVLYDHAVPKDDRIKRAEAVEILGRVFQEAHLIDSDIKTTARQQVEEALRSVMEQARDKEDSGD